MTATDKKTAMETFLSTSWGREYQAGKRGLNNALDCLGSDFPDGRYGWIAKALYNTEPDNSPKRLPAPAALAGTRWEKSWEQWSGEPEAKGRKRLASEIEDAAVNFGASVEFAGPREARHEYQYQGSGPGDMRTGWEMVANPDLTRAVNAKKAEFLAQHADILEMAQRWEKSLEPVMLDSFGNPIK